MRFPHTDRLTFTTGAAVALYTAAAFGAVLMTPLPTALACIVAAVFGIGVAALAGSLVFRERVGEPAEAETAPEPHPTEERGFAVSETREERESREIQTALLPTTIPFVEGYHIDAAYDPCGSLGGDLYDIIDCGDGRVIVTLGDVSGKGPSGAIVMAMVQTLFRREARVASGPADLLRRVNDGFAGTIGKGVFVTAMAGLLDPAAHRFTLAAAGHHPMLLLNPVERRTTHVSARGLALGLVRGATFDDALGETTIDVAPGDSLLLYTDGATECVQHLATGVGENRFLAAAAAAVLPGPRDALRRLSEDLWQGGGRRDDTTMLLISRLGASADKPERTDRSTGNLKV